MTVQDLTFRRLISACGALLLVGAMTACASSGSRAPALGDRDADKFLFDRGTEALEKRHWLEAREYFRRLVDTYPGSQYRRNAKLGVGDSYLGENRSDSFILAANEFKEFLTFFPVDPRADYAQYKLAVSQWRQVLGPQRDQTATHEALREIETFLKNYPSSALLPEAVKLEREIRDRLSESEHRVGVFYYRYRNYAGAIQRLTGVLKSDPTYSRRDAVYFFLAESYFKVGKLTDAANYYDKLIAEFAVSEHLEDAKKRLTEIKR